MLGKSHAAHPSSPSAGRFDGDARQTRQRLLALDRRSGLRERGQETGDNTPWADALEEMQDGLAKTEVLASRELLLGRLKALSRAEKKVREGTYGVCDLCGKPIPAGPPEGTAGGDPLRALCGADWKSNTKTEAPSDPVDRRKPNWRRNDQAAPSVPPYPRRPAGHGMSIGSDWSAMR